VPLQHWNTEVDGPVSEQKMRDKLEAQGYSVLRYTYPPGTYFAPHTHSVDKIGGVLSGRFRMTMGGQSLILEAGDTLAVPKETLHSAEVIGNEAVVSLDAVKCGLARP